MKKKLFSWFTPDKAKQKVSEIEVRKETILYNLASEMTTAEAIALYQDVSQTFLAKVKDRLVAVSDEKVVIENFLQSLLKY